MGFWEKTVDTIIKKKVSDIEQQINIKSSKEAVADVLNDNPEEMPDEIPEDQTQPSQNDLNQPNDPNTMDNTGMGGDNDMNMGNDSSTPDDMGSSMDDTSSSEPEEDPNKIKKNEFSDINNKILIIESYDRLLETINKTKELFGTIPELNEKISSELEKLNLMIIDEKNSVGIYTKAENYIRYRLFFNKVNSFIKNLIEEYKKEIGTNSKEQLNILEKLVIF